MNEQIKKLAEQAGIVIPKDSEYNGHIYRNSIEKFAQLIKQAIYDKVKEELVDDEIIDAETDLEDRCYLRGSNGGTVDALYIIKNFGVEDVGS